MKIKLRRDYEGKETENKPVKAGTELDLREDYAERLVEFGYADYVEPKDKETGAFEPTPFVAKGKGGKK